MSESFGRRILGLSPAQVLSLERIAGFGDTWTELDAINARLIQTSLAGVKVVNVNKEKPGDLEIAGLSEKDKIYILESFLLSNQQSRGAWFLPESGKLDLGSANFPSYFLRYPRFACGIADNDSIKFDFDEAPNALYFWAVLEPLFQLIFWPFFLRSTKKPTGDRDEKLKTWKQVDEGYKALGLQVNEALAIFRYGGGWSKLGASDQGSAKQKLLQALQSAANPGTGAFFRAYATQALVKRYYSRAAGGPPAMRQVLTKPLEKTLSAFFGGDWLLFLRYIGEAAHPEERIATVLPEPKLFVDSRKNLDSIATKHGLPAAEIERILSTFWGEGTTKSPVERRVEILRRYWQHFDDVHARQEPGMPSLWGFVEEGFDHEPNPHESREENSLMAVRNPGSYRKLLPSDLLAVIQDLWGGILFRTKPNRIVSNTNPHSLIAETFGAALRFWHGVALTAWFVAEGPDSRTDMKGLAKYHAKDLRRISELGHAIDPQLFEELVAVEKSLGDPTPMVKSQGRSVTGGITLNMEVTWGSRRGGFDQFRNIITKYRRRWTNQHLDSYLRARWETEIRAAVKEFSRLYEIKAKVPAPRNFARFAELPTNHWFGGDLSSLYAAFGEKFPLEAGRVRLMPRDAQGFWETVFKSLGGQRTNWHELSMKFAGEPREKLDSEYQAHCDRQTLAGLSVWYVQLSEAFGKPPALKEFGQSKFAKVAPILDTDIEKAWSRYSKLVQDVLAGMKGL